MKIYIAAFYQSRKAQGDGGTAYARAAALADPAHCLESFYYIGNKPRALDIIRNDKRTIFLDSGAFSTFTQNVKVDLKQYARFIERNRDIIEVVASLDIIGRGQEQKNYDQLKGLETLLGGRSVLPVHHVRDEDYWLQRYIDEGYDTICLGGMVGEKEDHRRKWLYRVWDKYLTKPDGTPKVKVHGFGLTSELMFRYPWHSVDSTSWAQVSMNGAVLMDLADRDYTVTFSSKSSKRNDIKSWHFNSWDTDDQRAVLQRLEELEAERIKHPQVEAEMEAEMGFQQGYNGRALAMSYGWRDHFNINYFKRAQDRGVTTFDRHRGALYRRR